MGVRHGPVRRGDDRADGGALRARRGGGRRGAGSAPGRSRAADGGERHRILTEWNDTAAAYPAAAGIHHLFEEQAARTPDAPALAWETGQLTYGELNARANQVAHCLVKRGARSESRVGVCLERGVDLVVSLLGILMVGGAYVPLEPRNPPARRASMIADSAVEIVVSNRTWAERIAGAAPLFCIDEERTSIALESSSPVLRTGDARPAGVRDLYVGLDRSTEGGDEHP